MKNYCYTFRFSQMLSVFFSAVLLLFATTAFSQIDFGHELYAKIAFEKIVVKGNHSELSTHPEVYDAFYTIDTVINCWSAANPEFVNNYYSGTGYYIIETLNELDTSTNKANSLFVDLVKINRDDNGNYLGKSLQFSFERKFLDELDEFNHDLDSPNDKALVTPGESFWAIQEVRLGNDYFLLDNCHKSYRLSFDNSYQFRQAYKDYTAKCTTIVDVEKTKTDGRVEYWYGEILHRLSSSGGAWKTVDGTLMLLDAESNKLRTYRYSTTNNVLSVMLSDNYEVVFKRVDY